MFHLKFSISSYVNLSYLVQYYLLCKLFIVHNNFLHGSNNVDTVYVWWSQSCIVSKSIEAILIVIVPDIISLVYISIKILLFMPSIDENPAVSLCVYILK